MSDSGQAQQGDHPIAAHLRQAGITKALIVDDAYDPPTRDTHEDDLPAFWDSVMRDPEILAELRSLMPNIEEEAQIDDDLLVRLWAQRETLPKLGPVLSKGLFTAKLGDLSTLQRLSEYLSQLGVTPVPVGSEDEAPDEAIKLVFIDYYLGPGVSSGPVNASTAKAKDLYSKVAADADRPFIVLMSSKPDAEAAKDAFREASGLLGGLFDFVSKEDLEHKETLYFRLATWAIAMPTRHEIQHFVEALEGAVKTAADDFVKRLRALGFEDYANIQWLSLQQDGHPLGDYMLWLYKSLLGYLLHDNPKVLAQQKRLDSMAFTELTPGQSAPSPQLAEIYRYALTEPGVEDVGPHPRAGEGNSEPLLQLGDLFFKEQSHEVLLVINAACDLAYAPGTNREFPKANTILLLHGHLQRFEEADTSDSARTELLKHDGRAYRILWDRRRVTAKQYGEVDGWLREQGYSRKARLTLPYALQVQQVFATNVMRIGTPATPPLFRRADVEVYCEGDDGNCMLMGDPIQGGALIIGRKIQGNDKYEHLFVFTLDCVGKIVTRLDSVMESCEQQKARLGSEQKELASGPDAGNAAQVVAGRLKGIEGTLDKLRQLKSMSTKWVPIVRSPSLLPPTEKRHEVDKKLLWVYHDRTFQGKYNEGPPIVMNLRPEKVSSKHAGSAAQVAAQDSAEVSSE